MDDLLNIILPCAGLGTRLGLPYPKEIHLVAKDTALIDLTMQRLTRHSSQIKSVTVIVSPEKPEIVSYLNKWSDVFYIRFCYFDNRYFEWAGSVLSSSPDFGSRNIVFLPDSFLEEREDYPIIDSYQKLFAAGSKVVFSYMEETRPNFLKNLGALKIQNDNVEIFCDKPDVDFDRFNGFWTSFGFTKDVGPMLLNMMTKSIQRNSVDINKIDSNASAFPVKNYHDLGVWPNLHDFVLKMHEDNKNPIRTEK